MCCDKLLSIIIPAYNVEKYVVKCLDSIFSSVNISDIPQIEIVVINNGSYDGTRTVLGKYSVSHHINIIDVFPNEGISNARNRGLKAALGKYVMFMDSDDYLVEDSLSYVLRVLREDQDVDIVEFGYREQIEGELISSSRTVVPNVTSGAGQEIFSSWVKEGCFNALVWVRVILRSLIIDNEVYFYPNISYEDEEWVPRLFAYAKHVIFLPVDVYVYRRRMGSVTYANSAIKAFDMATVCDSLFDFSKRKGFSSDYEDALRQCASDIYWGMFYGVKHGREYDEEVIRLLKERHYLITYSKNIKRKIFYRMIIDICGIKGLYFLKYATIDMLKSFKRKRIMIWLSAIRK